MRKKNKLVYGVGINDADYKVQIKETVAYSEEGKQIQKLIWICPFYVRWRNMLKRCYNEKSYHTYKGCITVPEWHYFMTFRAWMEKQDWKDKELDKDILFPGNKIYGPETCVFVSTQVNTFFNACERSRGIYPTGVTKDLNRCRFQARCNSGKGRTFHLGYYDTPEEAHDTWLAFKLEQAYILAAEQTDPRVAKALIDRYENYGKLD